MNPSLELLTQAANCRYCQGDLQALASALPADDTELDRLLSLVNARTEPRTLTNLMLAALVGNRPLDARHLITAAPVFDNIDHMLTSAGHCCGDLPAAMVTAVRDGHMGWEREALALAIAAWHCRENNQPWPDGLMVEARLLARRITTPEARSVLMVLAHFLNDANLWSLLDPDETPFVRKMCEESAGNFARRVRSPVLQAIPELPPPTVLTGGTIQRAVARIGRNDRCPCGSGKKYKRCCLEQDLRKLRDSSEIAGVTRQDQRESPEEYLTEEKLWQMRSHEVVGLDPALIPSDLYTVYINRLNEYGEFEAVLAFLAVNGVQEQYREHIHDSIEYALSENKPDLARRLAAYVPDYDVGESTYPVAYRFARDSLEFGPALELIESAALKAVDETSPTDFICQIFDVGLPALGIMLGRGAVACAELWEAETVLSRLLEARDRLELPPADLAEELFDQRLLERVAAEDDTAPDARDAAGLEEMQAAKARAEELEKSLAAKQRALQNAQQELARRQRLAARSAVIQEAPSPEPNPEVDKLQAEIAKLKQEVKLNHADRNRFRRKLKAAVAESEAVMAENAAIRAELARKLATHEAVEDEAPELLLPETVAPGTPLRLPVFADRFTAGLGRLPEDVARKAIHLSGRLAAGEEAAFHGAKRLVANRAIIRQRLGVYRLLFRLEERELVVLECVHRRDLERAVERNS
jgi:mRNA-degrading endonuclease RelE of RelBE toxin-antitoxin system